MAQVLLLLGLAVVTPARVCGAVLKEPAQNRAAAALVKIDPPLKDVASDKKFFGPPFPADYPDDKRPAVQKSILDKLKGPDQPYPALQNKATFDTDFVKDENADKGAWKAQFEYDALRKKLAKEGADEKRAQNRADKEGRDVDDARKKSDDAAQKARDAQKDVDDARSAGSEAQKADDVSAAPSTDSLEEMKKKVAEAEANYAKEQQQFEECKKQLEDAKAAVDDLKAKHAAMEAKATHDSKLWAETKTVRLNLQKAKKDAAEAKHKAAQERLRVAERDKVELERALSKEKAESEKAQEDLQKERAEMLRVKTDLQKATMHLQELRGSKAPLQSSTPMRSALVFLAISAVRFIL